MNRADLYLLSTPAMTEQVNFCCRLTEKVFHDFKRIHIQTSQNIQNEALDTALWTFKPESFLPHDIGQTGKHLPPIIIDNQNLQDELFSSSNLLILLTTQLPDNAKRFDRMCILVPNIEEEIQHARVLYKELKQQNIEVHIHDMR
ncbi:MAG: DNA polymerase-3 subunit chi [Oleiphilaceae bacterium]|jgi:DNA polymerase-3 subunit chi